jgi:uncharacterized protein (DUF58 family)
VTRHPSPKLGSYTTLAATFLIGAVALGRPELVALAAPFAVFVVTGLALSREPVLTDASVGVSADRLVEGETFSIRIELVAERAIERIDLVVPLEPGLSVVGGAPARRVTLVPGTPEASVLEVRCDRWGAFEPGRVLLRASDRWGLFSFDGRIDGRRPVTVYPRTETVRALVRPARTQPRFGNQVARLRGEGIEFSELRPFVAGDRVRAIDWKTTARTGSAWVRDRLPERNADLVIFLDSFSDVDVGRSSTTLERAVRAATTIAGAHLGRRDRVGIVSFGGVLRWLEPAMGIRQHYRIIDALLGAEVAASYAWKGADVIPVRTLPARALVLALSPLLDERTITALFDLRGRGFDVAIVDVSPVPPGPSSDESIEGLAQRIWSMDRQRLRRRFQGVGVAVAEWHEGDFLQRPLWEVTSFRRSSRLARAH